MSSLSQFLRACTLLVAFTVSFVLFPQVSVHTQSYDLTHELKDELIAIKLIAIIVFFILQYFTNHKNKENSVNFQHLNTLFSGRWRWHLCSQARHYTGNILNIVMFGYFTRIVKLKDINVFNLHGFAGSLHTHQIAGPRTCNV